MQKAFDLIKEKCMKDNRIGRSSLSALLEIVNQIAEEYKSNDGWIPLSSGRLPEIPKDKDYVNVLVTKQYSSCAEVVPTEYYEDDGFNDYETSLITAWKYDNLPQPYVKEK